MDFENLSIWYWVILILIAIIAAIIGYFIGKGKTSPIDDSSNELNELRSENAKMKADLEACHKKLEIAGSSSKSKTAVSSLTSAKATKMAFDANAAKVALGKKIKQDDLKIVEGIGPKIEGLFHKFDIKTWKGLSEVSTDKCQEILNSGGDRYRIHDPASWPMQAKMAYEGQWKNLAKWQDDHKAGKF